MNWEQRKKNLLKARVKARNKVNAHAIAFYTMMAAVFKPLIGEKVEKADGSLLAKIDKILPPFPEEEGLRFWRHHAPYSIAWGLDIREPVQDAEVWTYEKEIVYIARVDNQILTSMESPFTARTDYKASEIERLRKAYEKAKNDADKARSALFPFGESDS
jgi:hypothetical protein